MSGWPRCAREAPSRKRARPWTTEVGWMTTSIFSYGTPNKKCASISSRPLFASVAESTVILRPICQVGCSSACSGVTSASSSRLRPRNGPPEAVRTSESTSLRAAALEALEERGVLAVHRQQEPSPALPRRERELARRDEALLVRERERHASLERPERGWQAPRTRRTAFRTTSGSARSRSSVRSPPTCVSGARPSIGCGSRRGRNQLEARVRLDDLDRLSTDRARRSEQGDSRHPCNATIV